MAEPAADGDTRAIENSSLGTVSEPVERAVGFLLEQGPHLDEQIGTALVGRPADRRDNEPVVPGMPGTVRRTHVGPVLDDGYRTAAGDPCSDLPFGARAGDRVGASREYDLRSQRERTERQGVRCVQKRKSLWGVETAPALRGYQPADEACMTRVEVQDAAVEVGQLAPQNARSASRRWTGSPGGAVAPSPNGDQADTGIEPLARIERRFRPPAVDDDRRDVRRGSRVRD